jgi:hypothetical protein
MAPSETQRFVPPHARTTDPEPSDPSYSRSLSDILPGTPQWSPNPSSRPKSWGSADFQQKDWRHSPEGSPVAVSANKNPPPPASKREELDREWRRGDVVPSPIWTEGHVVQLPHESQVPANSPALIQVGGNPWNHPAVITHGPWETNGTKYVKVQNCTSLGGKGLEARREFDRKFFLKVTPDLLVEGSGNFSKGTYVNCSPTKGTGFTIEYDLLSPYICKYQGSFIKFNDGAMAELARMRDHPHDDSFGQP